MKALLYDIHPAGWCACRLLRPVWKNCRTSGLNGLTLREIDPPSLPGQDWVRVRTLLGGICGTDLAILDQRQRPDSILQSFSSMPMGLGHENVGVVQDVGANVDRGWIGRRVCVEPTLSCSVRGIDPPCSPCSKGHFGACENFGASGQGRYGLPAGTSIGYNARTGGAWGEAFVAHVGQLVDVPAEISDEQAVLTDPVACSLHGALRTDLSEASRVLVYGGGVLGLALVRCLRWLGLDAQVDVITRSRLLGDLARAMGASEVLALPSDAAGRAARVAARTHATVHRARFGNHMLTGGYDVTFDCVGSDRSVTESLKWTAARGQVGLVATASVARVDLTPVWFRELTILGVYGRQDEHWEGGRSGTYRLVHRMMMEGADFSPLLTHRMTLGEYRRALTIAMDKARHGAVKVAFDFRPGPCG